MKRLSKILCLFLASVLSLGCLASCMKKSEETPEESEKIKGSLEVDYTGVHDFSATETNEYLVKNGKTEYTLVYPVNDNIYNQYAIARKEFVKFFTEATGANISVLPDAGLTWDKNKKYISIGENELTKQAGIDVHAVDLNTRGVRIETVGKTIFMYGNTPVGALNAVYDFLEIEFNLDFYYVDNYALDTGVKDVKLKNYNVTDIPDITNANFGTIAQMVSSELHTNDDEKYYGYRTRRPIGSRDVLLNALEPSLKKWESMHNTFLLLPKEIFMKDHPKWYSDDSSPVQHNPDVVGVDVKGQLCYTAHGDSNELKLMKEEMAKAITRSLIYYSKEQYPYANGIAVTHNDGTTKCSCSACLALQDKYKSESTPAYGSRLAAQILFMNDVADLVEEWMNSEEGLPYKRDDFTIYIFAYSEYNDAPVKYDAEQGKYVPISEEVRPNSNVGVWYCAGGSANTHIYGDSQSSQKVLESFKKQGDLFEKLMLYTYSGNSTNAFDMVDTIKCNSDFFKVAQSCNTYYLYDDNLGNDNKSAPGFSLLKQYLFNKLTWNANQEDGALIEKFFKGMYKDGWQEVYDMYQNLRMINIGKSENGTQQVTVNAEKYQESTMNLYFDLLEEAKAKNERYKNINPELYEKLMFYIDIEWMLPAYWTLTNYTSHLSPSQLVEMRRKFKQTGTKMGMGRTGSIKFSEFVKNFPD